MDRDNISGGISFILQGIMMATVPILVDYFLPIMLNNDESVENSPMQEMMEGMLPLIDGMGFGIRVLGASMIVYGLMKFVTGVKYGSSGFDSLNYYDSSTKTLVFWVLEKRKFKNIDVKLGSLSDKTIEVLRSKIETPLKELYEAASKGKRAKAEYRNCSVYISSLADDLNKAISQCENELMEEKLIDKLYIIENTITNIKDKINDAITADKDEERYLKELQLESYEPFTLTDNMNKLI